MNIAVLSLGSNSIDKESQMSNAIKHMCQLFDKAVVSEIYEVPAHNGIDAPYLNSVMVVKTSMSKDITNVRLKQWEFECGRTLESKLQGSIPIDIDIVVWNGDIIRPVDYSRSYVSLGISKLLASLVR